MQIKISIEREAQALAASLVSHGEAFEYESTGGVHEFEFELPNMFLDEDEMKQDLADSLDLTGPSALSWESEDEEED